MSSINTSFPVTQTSSGVVFDICSEDINMVLPVSGSSGSNVFYMIDRSTAANIFVNETPAAIKTASENLIPLTNTSNSTVFYMNPDKIAELIDNGSGTKIIFTPGNQTTEVYIVDESRIVIRALIAAVGPVLTPFSYLIGAPGVTGVDYNFTSAANTTEQSIQLGATTIIGSNDAVVSIVIECITDMNAAITGVLDVGRTSGSDEYVSSTPSPTVGFPISVSQTVYPSTSATSVYYSMTPSANWSTMSAGKWRVTVIRENIQ